MGDCIGALHANEQSWLKKAPMWSPCCGRCCLCRRTPGACRPAAMPPRPLPAPPASRKEDVSWGGGQAKVRRFRGCTSAFELGALGRAVSYLKTSVVIGIAVLNLIKILTFAFCHAKVNVSFCLPSKSVCGKQAPGVEPWLSQICRTRAVAALGLHGVRLISLSLSSCKTGNKIIHGPKEESQ